MSGPSEAHPLFLGGGKDIEVHSWHPCVRAASLCNKPVVYLMKEMSKMYFHFQVHGMENQ